MEQNKKIYMIHEINDNIMEKIKKVNTEALNNNEEIIFTFDDGLYTQYLYKDELNKLNFPRIFFISLNIIRNDNLEPDPTFIKCSDAHNYFFNNYKSNNQKSRKYYMSTNELKEIHESSKDNIIGLHGYNHLEIISRPGSYLPIIKKYGKKLRFKLKRNIKKFIEIDIIRMFNKIKINNLTFFQPYYCYPYNNENQLVEILLQKNSKSFFGRKIKLFGKKRIDICTIN